MNDKETKELNELLSRAIIKQEKLKQALHLIDDLIKSYEYHHEKMVISDQPDKVEVTKQTIDNLEKIRKILEE